MVRALISIALPTLASLVISVVAVLVPESQRDFWLNLLALLISLTVGVILLVLYLGARHLLRARFKVLRHSEYDGLVASAGRAATPPVESRTFFKDETVRLATLPTHSNALMDYTFEHCVILGPAVLWLEPGVRIEQNMLDCGGRPDDDFFTVLPEGAARPPGALVLNRCTFRQQCDFKRVSFVGHAHRIRTLREGFGLPATSPDRTYFKGETVRLAELADEMGVIEGKTFEDCRFLGPALVTPLTGMFSGWSIKNPEHRRPDDHYVELQSNWLPVGVVTLKDCVVRDCESHRIGFAGPKVIIEKIRGATVLRTEVPLDSHKPTEPDKPDEPDETTRPDAQ